MNGSKQFSEIGAHEVSTFDYDNGEELVQKQKGGTAADAQDMSRMGKRQQLQRNFQFISIVGFVMILQSSWESVLL